MNIQGGVVLPPMMNIQGGVVLQPMMNIQGGVVLQPMNIQGGVAFNQWTYKGVWWEIVYFQSVRMI